MAWRGEMLVIPWTCFSSVGRVDFEVRGPMGRMSARALGAMMEVFYLDNRYYSVYEGAVRK
jgi:hypothetical protein